MGADENESVDIGTKSEYKYLLLLYLLQTNFTLIHQVFYGNLEEWEELILANRKVDKEYERTLLDTTKDVTEIREETSSVMLTVRAEKKLFESSYVLGVWEIKIIVQEHQVEK